jgi:uncharacterized protein YdhG (YjbR/CyaY superfamily)
MSPAETISAYLAGVSADARPTLDALMEAIRREIPAAEEKISYGVPTFFVGKPVVAVSASAKHCGLHLMSPGLMAAVKDDLPYKVTTSTIHFQLGQPVPAALVRRLVKARLSENQTGKSGYARKEPRSA